MNPRNLHFFTTSFPIGEAPERVFIEPELPFLSSNYETIYIYPQILGDLVIENLPSNVKVVRVENTTISRLKLKEYFQIFRLLLSDALVNARLLKWHNLKLHFSLIKKHILKKNQLKNHFEQTQSLKENDLIYIYWMDEWCTVISLLKEDSKFQNKIISRVHGFDLYDERNELGKIPFRKLQLKNLDKVFSISQSGKDYLIARNHKFKNKFDCSRLGVHNHGISNFDNEIFTLVSCSSITPVKRVHLIVELLANVKQNIRWVHFGDGPLLGNLEADIAALPSNVTCQMMGNVSNNQIITYYKQNSINLFLNVSESEGIPMSIMEAISFSIPVMAFNVGGISEIVNQQTGCLVEANNLDKMIAVLNDFPNHPIYAVEKRKEVRTFWEQNFDAEKNHGEFVIKLM